MTHTLLRAGALSCALQSGPLKAALGCALLASTCLTGPALAQGGGAAPPVYRHVDANGVDITDGSFHFSIVEASVGAGAGEMALVTSWGTHRGDNFNRMMHRSVASGTAHFAIVIGNRSRTFSGPATGTSFASGQAAGETLVKLGPSQYRYTEADGTVTEFGQPYHGGTLPMNELCATGNETSCRLLGLSTAAPDGAALSYDWHVEERCWDEFDGLSPTPVERCGVFHRLASIANNAGTTIAYDYSEVDFPGQPQPGWYRREGATLSTPTGGTASAIYSFVSARVTDVTDMGGRTWRLTTDISNRLIGIRRPGSASDDVTVAYGPSSFTVTRDGVATSYARTVSGSLGTMVVTDALGRQRTIVSNLAIGRPTQITDELQRTTLIAYDNAGRPTQVTQPEGNQLRLTYDGRGNVVETRAVARPGSGDADIVATAAFPAACANIVTCNQPTSTTDPRGNTTDYSYDATHGGVLTATGPAATPGAVRPQARVAYAQVNGVTLPTETSFCQTQASCAGTADEVRTVVAYNADLSVHSVTARDGAGTLSATTTNGYDPIGNLTAVDGPLAGAADTVRFRYDAARQRVGAVSPDPDGAGPLEHRAERITYRPDGQASRVETGTVDGTGDADWAAFAGLEQVDIGFDANHRPVSSALTAGGTVHALSQTSYDALGRPECAAQRMNPDLFAAGTDACEQHPLNGTPDRIARTVRDAAGQVTEVHTAVGTPLETAEVRTTYTGNGQVGSLTDGMNNRTSFEYDGHDRLRRTFFPVSTQSAGASNPDDYDQRTYDPAGNVTAFRHRSEQVTRFSYDALNRLTLIDRPLGWSELDTSYGYDLLGRLTRATTFYDLTFTYDALGRQVAQSSPHGTIASEYDLAGRRTRLTWPAAPGESGPPFFVDYDYLTTGEMTRIRENGATSGIGVLATFAYDDLGRRTSLTRGNGIVTSYGYDPASRLTSLAHAFGNGNDVTLAFAHNAAGQIVGRSGMHGAYAFTASVAGTRTDTHNGRNQIATVNGASVAHDTRGNLVNDGSRTFGYASDNRMVQGGAATLFYDPLDRLRFVQSGANVQLIYDGSELIAEHDYHGLALLRRYVHGPGIDEPLVWYEGSGTNARRWLIADERGSVIGAFDDSGGGLGYVAYDEDGRRQVWGNPGRFGFTGQQWLPEVGMYYFRARMYDPDNRFLQPDPIGYGDGLNLYNPFGGDPINRRDPNGACYYEVWGFYLGDSRVDKLTKYVPVDCGPVSGGGIDRVSQPVMDVGGGGRGRHEGAHRGGGAADIVVTGPRRESGFDLSWPEAPRPAVLTNGFSGDQGATLALLQRFIPPRPPRPRGQPRRDRLPDQGPRGRDRVDLTFDIFELLKRVLPGIIPWARTESIEEGQEAIRRYYRERDRRPPRGDGTRCLACD